METREFKFGVGEVIKDKVTGFEGVVMCQSYYFTGGNHYGLVAQEKEKDGGVPDYIWLDESRLVGVSKAKKVELEPRVGELRAARTSGPHQHGPQF